MDWVIIQKITNVLFCIAFYLLIRCLQIQKEQIEDLESKVN